jgi:hypothetical protein
MWSVGAVCVGYAAVLWGLQRRAAVSRGAGTAVIGGWLPLTGLGVGLMVVQALAVAGLADLQLVGLRRVAQVTG